MKHAHEENTMKGKKAQLTQEHKGWKIGTKGVVIDEISNDDAWFEVVEGGASFGAMSVPYDKLERMAEDEGRYHIHLRGVD